MAKFWNSYGDWDEIARSKDIKFIMSRITGKPVEKWRANYVSRPTGRALATVIGDSVVRWGSHLSAVDFGCGVGRNAALLSHFYGTLYGVDIPEMIEQFETQDPIKKRHLYTAIHTDLARLAQAHKFHLLYDSVVFQHILDEEFTARCVEVMHGHETLDCFISLNNKAVGKIPIIQQMEAKGWTLFHEEADTKSFEGIPHTLYILRR